MTDTLPADYDRLAPWFNVLRQCNSTIVCGVTQLVTVTVLIGPDGRPCLWSEPERCRLYPRSKAAEENNFSG